MILSVHRQELLESNPQEPNALFTGDKLMKQGLGELMALGPFGLAVRSEAL